MTKPGPRQKTAEIHQLRGTARPDRPRKSGQKAAENGLKTPENGSKAAENGVDIPDWLTGRAKKVWREKVERYAARGQAVAGFEFSLAQYCVLEAYIVDKRKKKLDVPITTINAHRIYATEFGDMPNASSGTGGGGSERRRGGKFSNNGRRPV